MVVDNSHSHETETISQLSKDQSQWKTINPSSKNRRERNRDKTPESNNRNQYEHHYYTRVTFKMEVKASDDPIAIIRQIVKEFLREINQIDNQAVILPWKSSSNLEPLTTVMSLPTTVTGINKYLHKLYTPKKGNDEGIVYPHIRIGHDINFYTIREEIQAWVAICGHGIFYNMLQKEDGVEIGWLLYSTRETNAGALADEIIDSLGFNIGLRWKVISTGTRQISQANMVQALAVECSAKIK